ncbi:hypothetical protein D3C85_1588050 [compost metagenome]
MSGGAQCAGCLPQRARHWLTQLNTVPVTKPHPTSTVSGKKKSPRLNGVGVRSLPKSSPWNRAFRKATPCSGHSRYNSAHTV